MDFTNDDIASLGDKLTALDLTDGEAEALRTLVAIAVEAAGGVPEDEVAGFYLRYELENLKADFGSLGLRLGPPAGRFASDGGLGTTRIVANKDGSTT